MYQPPLNLASSKSFDPVMLTEMALRSAEQLYCMNVSATSVFLQTQASAASVLGLPDFSPMIAATSEQARQVLTASTDQFLNAAHQASEVMQALQRTTTEMVGEHSAKASEALQAGMKQLGDQALENFGNMSQATKQMTSDAASLTAKSLETTLHKPNLPLSPLSEAVQDALPSGPGDGEIQH